MPSHKSENYKSRGNIGPLGMPMNKKLFENAPPYMDNLVLCNMHILQMQYHLKGGGGVVTVFNILPISSVGIGIGGKMFKIFFYC